MSASYTELHAMLDRLTPEQAEANRGVMHVFAAEPAMADRQTSRRLPFIGLIPDGPTDLADRSEDIIRARFHDAA